LLGAGGSLALIIALVLGGIFITSGGARTQHSANGPGKVFVSSRIGSAYELTANETPYSSATPSVAKAAEDAEIAFSLDLMNKLALVGGSATNSSRHPVWRPRSRCSS
jgi:hypothetical protein